MENKGSRWWDVSAILTLIAAMWMVVWRVQETDWTNDLFRLETLVGIGLLLGFFLGKSKFRSRFRLGAKERAYLDEKTLAVVLEHGRRFVVERLADAQPKNDGKQTPMRGHPIFIAQHATATCCRGCLEKWHHIPRGQPLTEREIDYVLAILERWLNRDAP